MGYSLFSNLDTAVFVEIFAVPVNGTPYTFSVQRRFEVTEKWVGDMESMPVAADRRYCGTPFVPAEVAMLLINSGVLRVPESRSWCVQYAGSGWYCDSAEKALYYCARRWPAAMAMFADDLNRDEPLKLSQSRKEAFAENAEKLKPWQEQASALAEQIRSTNATPVEG